jgi:hypothetical protein
MGMTKKKTASDPMQPMRKRYDLCVDADLENRDNAAEDWRFLNVRGAQWEDSMRMRRGRRPCYEFPVLRAHWRQVVNDQKRARPSIKVRPVENGDANGAELRAGILKNIEQISNAERAYDSAFEYLTAVGFGAWLVTTRYTANDAWDQDLAIEPIDDPINSVWIDPDNHDDPSFGFIERTYSRSAFEAMYPDARVVSFDAARRTSLVSWFGEDQVRVVAYYRKAPYKCEIALLSDGRSVDMAEIADALDELEAQGITVQKTRMTTKHKVIMSICSGAEEIDGPHETVFHRIPIVCVWANKQKFEGKWTWCGMVRWAKDAQRMLNYNLTTAQEAVAKVPKVPYLTTLKMLEGPGVKAAWERAAAEDPIFLPYTPDPAAPGNRPMREPMPDVPVTFLQLSEVGVDMLKSANGIHDASLGARSNETSGKAILARQQEGDTATFDYQDHLSNGIRKTGELLVSALPKVYDTQRTVRIIGKDGSEKLETLYQELIDRQTGRPIKINDLSAGKYDVTVSSGPSYDTLRMEFVEALTQLGQGNPMIAQAVPDLIVKALDFPGADEAAERLKMLLPPPIQQQLSEGKELPPEAMQAMQQAQVMMEQAQQQQQALEQAAQQVAQEKAATDAEKQQIAADKALLDANFKRMQAELKAAQLEASVSQGAKQEELDEREATVVDSEQRNEGESAAMLAAQALIEQSAILLAQQSAMMERMTLMLSELSRPTAKTMQVIRDESGRVVGAEIVEAVNGA